VPVDRRTALRALVLPAVAGALGAPAAGCAAGGSAGAGGLAGDRVRLAVPWSGRELTRFREVLEEFTRRSGWTVSVLSAGEDIDAYVANRVARASTPDVAIVPRPSLVDKHYDRLVPIDPGLGAASPVSWQRVLALPPDSRPRICTGPPADGCKVYGVWLKAAYKSLVWYRQDLLPAPGPTTWDQWVRQVREIARAGRVAPLAIGAADGSVLTDWFENVLLSIDPDVYRTLAIGVNVWRDSAVKRALLRLAEIWGIPGAFPGGARRALLTQHEDSLLEVFQRGRAAMVAAPDDAYPVIKEYGTYGGPLQRFVFPPAGARRPVLVGGDAVVLMNERSEGARKLIVWLASRDAARIWAARGGFLSVRQDIPVTAYPAEIRDDNLGRLLADLRRGWGDDAPSEKNKRPEDPAAKDITFDLSDRLGGRLGGGEGRGTSQIFQGYLARVAGRGDDLYLVERAADETVAALDAAALECTGDVCTG
jgi:alpha-glucoside transport system substrate-binding protein